MVTLEQVLRSFLSVWKKANPNDKRSDEKILLYILNGMVDLGYIEKSEDGKFIISENFEGSEADLNDRALEALKELNAKYN